jgi:streptomycin 6-kinase
MNLPEEFTQRIQRIWGAQGGQWVEHFPDILAHCESAWGLKQISPFEDLSYNFVASAVTQTEEAVILKIGVPNPELVTEAVALRVYNGNGAARLLAFDAERGALLIEQLAPGTMLHHLGDNPQESRIAACLMAQLCLPPPEGHRFPSLNDWAKVFTRVRDNYRLETYGLPLSMLETAQQLAGQLSETADGEWLLHGDLHHFNILYDRSRGWTVIDPKGVIGDRAFQAARFFCNPIPVLLSSPDLLAITRQRAEIISAELEIDQQRILEWAYVDCTLGACWSIEESEGIGVSYFVECAGMISKILGK